MSSEQEKVVSRIKSAKAKTVHGVLQLFLDAQKLGATRISLRPPHSTETLTEVEFFGSEKDSSGELLKATQLDLGSVDELTATLEDRAYYWPDVDDEFLSSNIRKPKRVLFAPLSRFRVVADLKSEGKRGSPKHRLVLEISRERIEPITEFLKFTNVNKEFLLRTVRHRNGLLLCNASKSAGEIDAKGVILALRPDIVLVDSKEDDQAIQAAVEMAEHSLVCVFYQENDPLESLIRFLGRVGSQTALLPQAIDRLLLSFVHKRIKRSCSECSRSTPVVREAKEQLPEILRSRIDDTYLFGRGCRSCGNSAYRGTVGLDSLVLVDDVLKVLIRQDHTNFDSITLAAYRKGTRSLLEDGLTKIDAGLSSFEEVFKAAPSLAASYLSAIEAIQKERSEELEPPTTGQSAEASSKKLLIVEDDSDQREVLELVFETEGFEVSCAQHGEDAISKLKDQSFDIVLCDVMMPVMDGLSFIKQVRKDPNLKHLPVMMLTAVSDPDNESSLLSFGADDYCDKAVKRKILLGRVQKLLDRQKTLEVCPSNPVGHLLAK